MVTNRNVYYLLVATQPTWENIHEHIFARQTVYAFTDRFGIGGVYHCEILLANIPSDGAMAMLDSHHPFFVRVHRIPAHRARAVQARLAAAYASQEDHWLDYGWSSDDASSD